VFRGGLAPFNRFIMFDRPGPGVTDRFPWSLIEGLRRPPRRRQRMFGALEITMALVEQITGGFPPPVKIANSPATRGQSNASALP
jgi:hypothetical protein